MTIFSSPTTNFFNRDKNNLLREITL